MHDSHGGPLDAASTSPQADWRALEAARAGEHAAAAREAMQSLTRYLGRVGRRVLWFKLVRGGAFAAGAGLTALLISTLTAGPSLGWLGASLIWGALGVAVILAFAIGVGRLDELRGDRRSLLISGYDLGLAERTRSAAALVRTPNGSPELVAAHASRVVEELSKVPLSAAVARPENWARMSVVAALLAVFAFGWLTRSEQAASGLYALFHPGQSDEQGTAIGLWVGALEVQLTFPEQLDQAQQTLRDPRLVSVPEGTLVSMLVTPRIGVERAVLKLGDQTLPMRADRNGAYKVTFTAETSLDLALTARIDERWVRDSTARTLVVAEDKAPTVDLDAPLKDLSAAPDEPVPFVYRAADDHGLGSLDLVVQMGPGRERRVHLASFDAESVQQRFASSTDVVPAAFGARSGQTLAVWIEARDRDGYGGVNVGRSPVRTITVGDAEDAHGAPVELLERTRDLSVDTLSERMETPLAEGSSEAKLRDKQLSRSTRGLVRALDTLATAYADGTGDDATAGLLRDMGKRLSRLSREEANAAEDGSQRELRKLDDSAVAELEDDVLWLSDLIGRAKLANAEHSLERLAATRARMHELLKQLRKSQDPARKAELMAEIARARAELAELAKKLSQVRHDVPGDFVNHEALEAQASEDPLQDLENALAKGDMEAAEKAMAALDQQLNGLEHGLSEGGEAFADARFGPRNAALEKARNELSELERAQKQIASETGRLADKARAERSQEGEFKAEADRLAQQAAELEERTRELEAGRMQSQVSESQASAAQRLRDARDALKQGDAQEARAMAQRAAEDLGGVSSEITLDSRMYPGPDGSRAEAAKKAGQLSRDVSRFAEEIEKTLPQEQRELSPEDGQALRKQAPAQRGVGEQASKLAQDMRDEGPPSLSDRIGRATRAMKNAAEALERGDVREAQAGQREALERLGEINEDLSRQERASRQGDSGEEGGGESGSSNEKVAIPEQGDDARRAELRRRVLDARRAQPPDSFMRSVERYYQEILR
ncbi:MAG: DUF4175 family protein [Myxococcales bacterium]